MNEQTFEEMLIDRLRNAYPRISWELSDRHIPEGCVFVEDELLLKLRVHRYREIVFRPSINDHLKDARFRMLLDARLKAASHFSEEPDRVFELISDPAALWSKFDTPLDELGLKWWINTKGNERLHYEDWKGHNPVEGVRHFLDKLIERCAEERREVDQVYEAVQTVIEHPPQ